MTEDRESWAPRLDNKETLSTTEFDTSRNRDGILVGIRWFEFPLLFYFMVHFFPPMPAGIANVCLLLGVVGVLWECRTGHWHRLRPLGHPLVIGCVLFVVLLAISLLQAPEDLLRESWRRLSSDLLKHTLFSFVLLLYLDTAERARRILQAGMLACFLMVAYCLVEVVVIGSKTGKLPFQRDYLFYSMFFFPFSLVAYRFESRWRYLSIALGASIIALAFLTGFRGAVLALFAMSLLFVLYTRSWGVLGLGAVMVLVGVGVFTVWFPEQAAYVFSQFQKTHSSGRISGHWLPAWDMSMQSPWLGHGFGHHIFSHLFGVQIDSHPDWWTPAGLVGLERLPRSPHSVVFETLFMAGWPALLLLGMVVGSMIFSLGKIIRQRRDDIFSTPWLALALAVFISVIGNFMFFYQTEDPSWRTIPIMVALVAACLTALRAPPSKSS